MARPLILRGYIEQTENGEWFGICVTLNLSAVGRSLEEADHKLRAVVIDYLEDVSHEGDFDRMVPRHAPLSFYLRYLQLQAYSILHRPSGDWRLFSDCTSPCALNA